MDKLELELKFKNELMRTYEEAKNLGYRPTRFLGMFYEHGSVKTAKKLLATKEYIQEGIIRLWELNRLDLSLEALVLKPNYKELFTQEELNTAKKRLKDLNYQYGEK